MQLWQSPGDQPRLAEHIRKRTKDRLNECVRQGETGRKHRRSCRRYIQAFCDLRNNGIHRAHEKRRREDDKGHQIEDSAHELDVGRSALGQPIEFDQGAQ
jgi:hypothetical protein